MRCSAAICRRRCSLPGLRTGPRAAAPGAGTRDPLVSVVIAGLDPAIIANGAAAPPANDPRRTRSIGLFPSSWPDLFRPSTAAREACWAVAKTAGCRPRAWMPATSAGMTPESGSPTEPLRQHGLPDSSGSSALPQQLPKTFDAIVDACAAQRVPDDRLQCRHDTDTELLLERLDGVDHRPVRGGEHDRVGLRELPHRLAAEIQGVARRQGR